MNVCFDRIRAMHLSGTVPIPSPFPELGRLSLVRFTPEPSPQRPAREARKNGIDCVRIEHVQSLRVSIARNVLLEDIQAVFLPRIDSSLDLNQGEWLLGQPGRMTLRNRLSGKTPQSLSGIIYVREQTQVLMQVEVGMTAAESVEYYPPVARERTDRHYDLAGPCNVTSCCD